MSTRKIFRDYDQGALDKQYNSRAAVPKHAQYVERWTRDGDKACEELSHHLDLAYGDSAAEQLDVFPATVSGPAPVQVFFHGGYWMSRDKRNFRFLARTFVPAGAVFITVNYGLIPTVDMDELVRQCRTAVAWVYGHAKNFGGDPDRIHVSGHSVGGHVVAMLMATDWAEFADLPDELIRGGCTLSGLFDLIPVRLCYINETLQLTPEQVSRNSPMQLAPLSTAPLILACGGLESDEFRRQSAELGAVWNQQGASCQVMERPGFNHFTIVHDLSDRRAPLAQAVLAQMQLA